MLMVFVCYLYYYSLYMYHLSTHFDLLLLYHICDIDSMTGLNLPNYQMFFQPGNRQGHSHCGLVIYVHNQFNANNITAQLDVEHTGWDYLCLEISHQKPNSKKYLLSNIYRLPNEIVQDVNTFTDEFFTISLIVEKKKTFFFCLW